MYIFMDIYMYIFICMHTHTNTHKGAGTHLEVLKNLDNCEWCAGQQAFFRSLQSCLRDNAAFVLGCLRIHISDVVVKIMTVCVAQPLHVLLNRYRVAQVVVHGAACERPGESTIGRACVRREEREEREGVEQNEDGGENHNC